MKYILAILVVVLVGGFLIFRYQTRDLNFNQQEVEALAARLLPGAKPPQGSKGVLIADKELFEAAVFAPSLGKVTQEPLKGSELRVVVARIKQPPTDATNIAKWKAFLEERKDLKHLGDEPTSIGRHPALKGLTQAGEGPRMLDYTTVFLFPDRGIVVQVEGPEASFNRAGMDNFFSALQLPEAPHRPSGPPRPPFP